MAKKLMLLLIFSSTVVNLISANDCSQYCVEIVSFENCESDYIFNLESIEISLSDKCVFTIETSFSTKGFATAEIEYTVSKNDIEIWSSYYDLCSSLNCPYDEGPYDVYSKHKNVNRNALKAMVGTNYVHIDGVHDTGSSCVDLEFFVGRHPLNWCST